MPKPLHLISKRHYNRLIAQKVKIRNTRRTKSVNRASGTSTSNAEFSYLSNGCSTNELIEHSVNENSCDSSEVNNDIQSQLSEWVVRHNISNIAANELLRILNPAFPDLPKDCRTLRSTPKHSHIVNICNGAYVHYGLSVAINDCFKTINAIDFIPDSIILDIGIDGLPLAKSSKSQLWPILGNIVNWKNPLVFLIGAYHGDSKPSSIAEYIKVFSEELKYLIANGIVVNNKSYLVKIRAFICDAPARAYVTNTIGHTDYYGCGKCTQKGAVISHRMTFPRLNAALRTDSSFRRREQPEHHKEEEIHILESLGIGMVTQFPLDYMHLVCLGIMKHLLMLWVRTPNRTYTLDESKKNIISKRLMEMSTQTPLEFCRKARPLTELERWKATEFRQFLLYTGPSILKGILKKNKYIHFLQLHCAVRILAHPEDCYRNNKYAHDLLMAFVKSYGILYGEEHITYNVHNLLHLSADVLQYGHLDNFSAFKFENYMQDIKKLIKKGAQPLQQISNRLLEKSNHITKANKDTFPVIRMSGSSNIISIEFEKFVVSTKKGNNCCITNDNKIILLTKLFYNNKEMYAEGRWIQFISSLYYSPCDSSKLGIVVGDFTNVEELETITIKITDIYNKMIFLNVENEMIFVPFLHSCTSTQKSIENIVSPIPSSSSKRLVASPPTNSSIMITPRRKQSHKSLDVANRFNTSHSIVSTPSPHLGYVPIDKENEENLLGPDIYNSSGSRTMCSSECAYEIQKIKKTLAYETQTIKKTLAYETQTIKKTLASVMAGVTAINQHLHRMTNTVEPPEIFNLLPKFPLDNADQLEQLETNCKTEESVAAQYTRKVASIGGKDVSSCTRKVMKSLFSNNSLETYTWCGFKKNKPIKEYTIMRIIIDTVCAAYIGSTNDAVETTIKRWLHYTKDRLKK